MTIFQQPQITLKSTVLVLCGLFGALGTLCVVHAISMLNLFSLAAGAFLLVTTVGLFLMQRWARTLGVVLSWMTLIVVVLGYAANPFENMERVAFGQEPLEWYEGLLNTSPILITCLWLIHVFGTYKSAFSKREIDTSDVIDVIDGVGDE